MFNCRQGQTFIQGFIPTNIIVHMPPPAIFVPWSQINIIQYPYVWYEPAWYEPAWYEPANVLIVNSFLPTTTVWPQTGLLNHQMPWTAATTTTAARTSVSQIVTNGAETTYHYGGVAITEIDQQNHEHFRENATSGRRKNAKKEVLRDGENVSSHHSDVDEIRFAELQVRDDDDDNDENHSVNNIANGSEYAGDNY